MLQGLVLIALAAVSWGTTGSVSTLLATRAGAHPLLVGSVRLWIAAILLVLVARPLALAARDVRRALGMGVCMAAFQATYFSAVPLAGIATTALVAICSAPLMIAALAVAFLGERPSVRVLLSLALGVTGTALLVAGPGGTSAPRPGLGTALALGAGLSYALYVVIAKRAVASARPLALTAVTFAVAAVLSTPLALTTTDPARQIALGWPWLLYLGAVATAGAYALYATGLTRVPASVAGIVSLLEPLTAMLLAMTFFGERFGPGAIAGGVLLLAGLALLTLPQRAARFSQ